MTIVKEILNFGSLQYACKNKQAPLNGNPWEFVYCPNTLDNILTKEIVL